MLKSSHRFKSGKKSSPQSIPRNKRSNEHNRRLSSSTKSPQPQQPPMTSFTPITLTYDPSNLPNFATALNFSNRLEEQKQLLNRAFVSEHTSSKEVYTPEEIAQHEANMATVHKGEIMTGFYREKIEKGAVSMWNKFYTRNTDGFFKDRHYFSREIPELVSLSQDYADWLHLQYKFKQYLIDNGSLIGEANAQSKPEPGSSQPTTTTTELRADPLQAPTSSISTSPLPLTITFDDPHSPFFATFSESEINKLKQHKSPPVLAEVGCGVGNTFWPILEDFPYFHLQGCDCAASAIKIIKEQPQYDPKSVNVSVCDISQEILPFNDSSADIVTLIYTLSALNPATFHHVLSECHRILKPNGIFYIRDYAIYDLTMLRFKKGQRLSHAEPFYFARGDGTRTFFFERERLKQSMVDAGFEVDDDKVLYIKKTVENKKMDLQMERRWIVAYGSKPSFQTESGDSLIAKPTTALDQCPKEALFHPNPEDKL